MLVTDFGLSTQPVVGGLALEPDHSTLVAGFGYASLTANSFYVARLTRAGALDTTFASSGLVHGIVLQMSPIGPSHSSIVVRLGEILLPQLLGRATVRIQQPFIAADESEPEPDVAVVPLGRYADRHPHSSLLIVEVAESSLGYDRETKAPPTQPRA